MHARTYARAHTRTDTYAQAQVVHTLALVAQRCGTGLLLDISPNIFFSARAGASALSIVRIP